MYIVSRQLGNLVFGVILTQLKLGGSITITTLKQSTLYQIGLPSCMAGRDGEEAPDQHLGKGEVDPPVTDVDYEPKIGNVPPEREDTVSKRLRPKVTR
jgi:hypothetical protein